MLDLKLGFRQRAAHHGPSKRSSMKAKCARSTSRTMGFRLCGLRYFDPSNLRIRKSSKKEGQEECQDSLLDKLLDYLRPLRERRPEADELDVRGIQEIMELLHELSQVIQLLPGFRFWGSSLLLARDVSYCFGQQGTRKTVCKLIDFSNFHMTYANTVDVEFLAVLENVQTCLAYCATGSEIGVLRQAPDLRPQDLEQVGVKEKRVGAAGRLLLNAALDEVRGGNGFVHRPCAPARSRTVTLPCTSVLNFSPVSRNSGKGIPQLLCVPPHIQLCAPLGHALQKQVTRLRAYPLRVVQSVP